MSADAHVSAGGVRRRQMPKKVPPKRSRSSAEVKKLLAQTYSRVLIPSGAGSYVAEILEFPGCSAEGESPAAAYAKLERAAEAWLTDWLGAGKTVPRPLVNTETSGRFALRLPKSLYVRASKAAAFEHVSLNQYIANAVAERVGTSTALRTVDGLVNELRKVGELKHLAARSMPQQRAAGAD
jgi:predicted HicB family RNase H-like nuclease